MYLLTGQLLEDPDVEEELTGVGSNQVQGRLCLLNNQALPHQRLLKRKTGRNRRTTPFRKLRVSSPRLSQRGAPGSSRGSSCGRSGTPTQWRGAPGAGRARRCPSTGPQTAGPRAAGSAEAATPPRSSTAPPPCPAHAQAPDHGGPWRRRLRTNRHSPTPGASTAHVYARSVFPQRHHCSGMASEPRVGVHWGVVTPRMQVSQS